MQFVLYIDKFRCTQICIYTVLEVARSFAKEISRHFTIDIIKFVFNQWTRVNAVSISSIRLVITPPIIWYWFSYSSMPSPDAADASTTNEG